VEKDKFKLQIGLYEILANTQTEIIDADGDIDLNKFAKPLLYAFVVEELGADTGKAKGKKQQSAALPGKADTSKAKDKKQPWIQQFMNDPNYDIIDTKYDGNCFFNMLRLALEENDQDISVDDMRDVLVSNVTEELFQNYKSLYEEISANEINLTREIKNITSRYNTLQAKIKTIKDRSAILNYNKQL
jgi:hypothetical protein